LDYLEKEGFVGGSNKEDVSTFAITGVTWKSPFTWKHENCLGFFKSYCEDKPLSTTKCPDVAIPFNKDTHCGTKTGADFMCPNKTDKKINDVRQKGIFLGSTKLSGVNAIRTALGNGVIVSTMEIFSDIFFNQEKKVYVPMSGSSLGHFAVKIVGYATEPSSPEAYWKVVVPFDETVGEKGIVWVRAGLNIGDIEINAYAINIVLPANLLGTTPPPPTHAL
jgi:hypothetical protein